MIKTVESAKPPDKYEVGDSIVCKVHTFFFMKLKNKHKKTEAFFIRRKNQASHISVFQNYVIFTVF